MTIYRGMNIPFSVENQARLVRRASRAPGYVVGMCVMQDVDWM